MNGVAQRVHTALIGGNALFVSASANERPEPTRGHRVAASM